MAFFIPVTVVSHTFQPSSSQPGEPSTLTLYIRSMLPPSEVSPLAAPNIDTLTVQPDGEQERDEDTAFDAGGMAVGHVAPVTFSRLSLTGPVWKQTVSVFPASLEETTPTTVHIHRTKITLPPLHAKLAENLPDTPIRTSEDTAEDATTLPIWPWILAAALAAVARLLWKKRHYQTPQQKLRQLPIIPQTLDDISEILSEAKPPINASTNPDFFAKLDAVRFSDKQPSMNSIRSLLLQADKLLQPKKN